MYCVLRNQVLMPDDKDNPVKLFTSIHLTRQNVLQLMDRMAFNQLQLDLVQSEIELLLYLYRGHILVPGGTSAWIVDGNAVLFQTLQNTLGLEQSLISRRMKHLQDLGLVDVRPYDPNWRERSRSARKPRARKAILTPKGQDTIQPVWNRLETIAKIIQKDFSEKKIKDYIEMNEAISVIARRLLEDPFSAK